MSLPSYQLGLEAEAEAEKFLTGLGWKVLTRRFRGRRGEVDLVARHGLVWVFVEVKASRKLPPYEALQARQMARLRAGAQEYLLQAGLGFEVEQRFDVLLLWGQPWQIQHIPDAF